MKTYAVWNNKGGVGKSYLTFQIASEYAFQNPMEQVVVIDMCPQANSSVMLLGGVVDGYRNLSTLHNFNNTYTKSISGYIQERIMSPYQNPSKGSAYITDAYSYNKNIPQNLSIIAGDQRLELQATQINGATRVGPPDAWRYVHLWISDLINDLKKFYQNKKVVFFIDCNPSFSIYTTIALSATDSLLIPFTADGSSLLAIQNLINLIYGHNMQGVAQSEFNQNSANFRMRIPKIYMYIGNRLTQMNNGSASGFKNIVHQITDEIYKLWQTNSSVFEIHPINSPTPNSKASMKNMFLYEVNDANTASVYSSVMGVPLSKVTSGVKNMNSRKVTINQSQLDKQVPNLKLLVQNLA